MQVRGIDFPDDLYYDRQHNWGRVEGNVLTQGLSDFGQVVAGDIVFAGLPRPGRQVQRGKHLLSLESGKWIGRVPALVSGKIVEANEALEEEAGVINRAPYGQGWLARIEMSDPAELDELMRADSPEFQAFIQQEMENYAEQLSKRGIR